MNGYLSASLEGIDCETCGYSYDQLEVEREGDSYDVTYSAGCYGGDGIQEATREEARSFIVETRAIRAVFAPDDVAAIDALLRSFDADDWEEE